MSVTFPTDAKPARRAGRIRFAPNPAPPTVELARAPVEDEAIVRHRALFEAVAGLEFHYPEARFEGRRIVICGGGSKYFPCVYVLVRLLRWLGCRLPIEVWHLGEREMSAAMRALLAAHDAQCVDGQAMRRVHPARRLAGCEQKGSGRNGAKLRVIWDGFIWVKNGQEGSKEDV